LNLAATTSAFSTPASNRSAVGGAAYYASPPTHRETMMTKRSDQAASRSSPTSIISTTPFDGGLCQDGLSYDFAERQPALVDVRPSNHSFVAAPSRHALCAHGVAPKVSGGDIAADNVMCLPCEPNNSRRPPMPVEATVPPNADSVKFNLSSPPGVNRRVSNHGPPVASGDGGGGNNGGNDGHRPTPQNLRDNPERQAKFKSEMCHYYEAGGAGKCPFGANCNYAHGKHELKSRYTTLTLMESSGQILNAKTYLSRPCMNWVSTGACPFGRRCSSIHDPSVSGTAEHPSWLPAATAKTNAQIIVDRLAAHRENAVHQENPLIAQSIWENCRPSQLGSQKECRSHEGKPLLEEQEWNDTYAMVCNSGVSVFAGGLRPTNTPSEKLSDLQKLCVVRLMRSGDGLSGEPASSQLHRDYVFAPTHSLHNELCMILQVRYFFLPSVNLTSAVDACREDMAKEISFDEYKFRTTPWSATDNMFDPSKCITAHEVAFAPKGDPTANISIWFDALPVKLEQSQIKRSRRLKQKKKIQIRNEHTRPNANGALISRTSSADFPSGPPDIDPFVPMLPAGDDEKSHHLIMAIVEHRIKSIVINNYSSMDEEQKNNLHEHMTRLRQEFLGMHNFHKKWTWPKRVGMENVTITTKAPLGNTMPYIPLKDNNQSPCMHIWGSFVNSISMLNTHADHSSGGTKRLAVFLSIDGSIPSPNLGGNTNLPHIRPHIFDWWNVEASSAQQEGTWKEILLGLPENGQWEAALRLHIKKREGSNLTVNKARNMPLSTIPFVQA